MNQPLLEERDHSLDDEVTTPALEGAHEVHPLTAETLAQSQLVGLAFLKTHNANAEAQAANT